jgi:phage baseplate assembly protein W
MPERRTTRSATRGLAWPLHADDRGSLALSSGLGNIEQSMRAILLTVPGERVMRPDFGCDIWRHLTGAMDAPALERAKACVHDAVVRWEPRVEVGDVAARDVDPGGNTSVIVAGTGEPAEKTCVDIDIAFTERATATRAIAQFRCVLTGEPAIVVHLAAPGDPHHEEWRTRTMLQRVRGAW